MTSTFGCSRISSVIIEKWIEVNEDRVDSHEMFREWVQMHSTHNYWREQQAFVIGRILESISFEHPVIVDLGCGAGTLSEYLLKSLKNVKVIGIDFNPFLLMICRHHLAEYRERFSVLLGDIRKKGTIGQAGNFHAAASLTFFHHPSRQSIMEVYRSLYESLPKGGLFVNGDVTSLSDEWFESLHLSEKAKKPVIQVTDFWQTVKKRYGIAEEIDEMNRLTGISDNPEHGYPASFYVNSLRWAGFKMADVVFQAGNRIVYCGKKV